MVVGNFRFVAGFAAPKKRVLSASKQNYGVRFGQRTLNPF
jgi:hypothetical protein